MDKLHKVILGSSITLLVSIAALTSVVYIAVENAGGVKAIVVEVGKDVKDIGEQIANSSPDKG